MGLEFYVGPPREQPAPDLFALPPATERHRWADGHERKVTPYGVPIREGHSTEKAGFSPHGCAYFGLDFLLNFDLNPKLCEVVEIYDDSMAPEFPSGGVVLVDLRRTEWVDGWVYALGTPALTVRRGRETPRGRMVMADNPEFDARPWSDSFQIVGKVVWTAHMVNTERVA